LRNEKTKNILIKNKKCCNTVFYVKISEEKFDKIFKRRRVLFRRLFFYLLY